MDIKISIIDICYAKTAPIPKTLMVLYFINEKFNKNAKVEKLTKKLGRSVRLSPLHFEAFNNKMMHMLYYFFT